MKGTSFLTYLYPTDPLYVRWVKTYIETWTETFGTWHLYRTDIAHRGEVQDHRRREKNESMRRFPRGRWPESRRPIRRESGISAPGVGCSMKAVLDEGRAAGIPGEDTAREAP